MGIHAHTSGLDPRDPPEDDRQERKCRDSLPLTDAVDARPAHHEAER
jgi:hypothetical protein